MESADTQTQYFEAASFNMYFAPSNLFNVWKSHPKAKEMDFDTLCFVSLPLFTNIYNQLLYFKDPTQVQCKVTCSYWIQQKYLPQLYLIDEDLLLSAQV